MESGFEIQRLRPKVHFSPLTGWMNDPNGLIFHDGIYHMFFQYDPDNTLPVSMHWGHAVSEDLICWKELPVALYPDENGVIYSGCVVADKENTSHLGSGDKPLLVSLFTYHRENKKGYSQSQGLAYSEDLCKNFKKYRGNPILTNIEKDFRDPMVFWHSKSKRWIMALAAGRSVMIYGSPDLLQWEPLSVFAPQEGIVYPGEVWECPSLFPLSTKSGKCRWVLMLSIFTPNGACYGVRYFIGNFDGASFTSETPLDKPLMLDFGWDFYAGALFGGMEGRAVMMGWMGCWYYARQMPSSGSRGVMSLPRELSLAETATGLCLAQSFVCETDRLFPYEKKYPDQLAVKLPEGACRIHLSMAEEDNILEFIGGTQILRISIDAASKTLHMDRRNCSGGYFGEHAGKVFSAQYHSRRSISFDMVLDETSLELFCDGGLTACTLRFFTVKPFETLKLAHKARELKIQAQAES